MAAAGQKPDRSAPPAPGPPPRLDLPPIGRHALSNGLPVWIVEMHDVPIADVTLVVKAGAASDPAGKFGLANFTAEMLDEGAGDRGALEIADAIELLGATLSTGSAFDASFVNLHLPVARLSAALPIVADVALRPTFPEKELQRVREELLTGLIQAQDDPHALVEHAFARLVFGPQHRYGTSPIGTAGSLKGFTTGDLRQFHSSRYGPSHSALIVTGDVTAAILPALEHAFGPWKGTAADPPGLASSASAAGRQVFVIDKPGAAQSEIRIGALGVPRSTPDYFALRVLNTVLGGAFTSRLNTNLREQHGYAYGASSTFEMRAAAGPFYAAAAVQTDKTAEALTEFFKELSGIRDPIPGEELQRARNYVALQLPRSFETTAGVARALRDVFVYDLPDDFFQTFTANVMAVTPADAQRVARRYIDPAKLAVVIVGDRKAIEAPVRALNLGPVRIVTVDEVMK
jgi:zinc protease